MRNRIVAIIQFCVQTLDYIWPKDEDMWIFGSNNGRKIDGNPKALYDGIQKRGGRKCYYITNDSHPNYKTLPFKSLRPLFTFLRAKNIVISHGLWDTGYLRPSSRKRVIEAWHGIPIKRIGFEVRGISKREISALKLHAKRITFFMVPSDYCIELFLDTLHIPKAKFLCTGQARNDILTKKESKVSIREKMGLSADTKLVLYAPTFRKNGDLPFFQFPDFEPEALDAFLQKENIVLLLRPHIDDSGKVEKFLTGNIRLFSREQQIEINEALAEMDGLITDYSSILIDYLLLNRPVFFTCYDYKDYIKNERGDFLEEDYLNWIPGPNILNQKEFTLVLTIVTGAETDHWKKQRANLKQKYHTFQTENTTARLIHFLQNS